MDSVGFQKHDHAQCKTKVQQALKAACDAKGLRLTPVRQQVLDILLESHTAMGAYAILERLPVLGFSAQPPVIYRALDFLVQNGFAHKIERLNAFIACSMPDIAHTPVFFICRACHQVAEASPTIQEGYLKHISAASGFVIEHSVHEAVGQCANCYHNSTT